MDIDVARIPALKSVQSQKDGSIGRTASHIFALPGLTSVDDELSIAVVDGETGGGSDLGLAGGRWGDSTTNAAQRHKLSGHEAPR